MSFNSLAFLMKRALQDSEMSTGPCRLHLELCVLSTSIKRQLDCLKSDEYAVPKLARFYTFIACLLKLF